MKSLLEKPSLPPPTKRLISCPVNYPDSCRGSPHQQYLLKTDNLKNPPRQLYYARSIGHGMRQHLSGSWYQSTVNSQPLTVNI
ncbi:hypothetical protein [Microcoleus sp. F4-D5]|uniref:hypothetical protein n=1 Tax=Microcoleus sp. F4-D5 TaxID=2818760 RepID=UPI002FD4F446